MDMREIETKFLEIDSHKVARDLKRLGAREDYCGGIVAVYFDDHNYSFMSRDESVRLRIKKKSGEISLTYKKKLVADIFRECGENEIMYGEPDPDTGLATFEKLRTFLGTIFQELQELHKHRTTLVHDGVRFEIDKLLKYNGEDIGFIPHLLEIEGSKKKIIEYADLLDLSMREAKPWSTRRTIEHYLKRRKKQRR